MMEKYSYHEFRVFHSSGILPEPFNEKWEGWVYEIYSDCPTYISYEGKVLAESSEWFDTEQEARFAAIGHIAKFEDGEG